MSGLATWMEAFAVYVAVRGGQFPQLIPDLMAYVALIARAARDYTGDGWLSYDFHFRLQAAAKHQMFGWGIKDVSLWSDHVQKSLLNSALVSAAQQGKGEPSASLTWSKSLGGGARVPVKRPRPDQQS